MEVQSTTTEKIIRKTIMITLETEQEVDIFKNMIRDIQPLRCGNELIANQLRNSIRKELEN